MILATLLLLGTAAVHFLGPFSYVVLFLLSYYVIKWVFQLTLYICRLPYGFEYFIVAMITFVLFILPLLLLLAATAFLLPPNVLPPLAAALTVAGLINLWYARANRRQPMTGDNHG